MNFEYLDDSYIVIDLETTNLEKGDSRNKTNHIVLASYEKYEFGELVKANTIHGNEMEMRELVEAIESSSFFVAHNAKFEYGWLKRCGMDITKLLSWCTMLGQYVINGNTTKGLKELGLDHIAGKYGLGSKGNLISILMKGGICPSVMPRPLLRKYCERDVNLTHQIYKLQREEVVNLNLMGVVYTRNITTPVLVEIESHGMHLDKERVISTTLDYEELYAQKEKELFRFTEGVNFNSPKQVAELVYDRLGFSELKDRRGNPIRTAADGRSTSSETLAKLKATNKLQREFLAILQERNKINAALTKNLRFFRAVVSETDDGIFYANLNQNVTKTHRLSSTGKSTKFTAFKKAKGIQFQNIPRLFKPLFKARKEGWLVGEIDAAQLEFRVAAFLGQDQVAINDIKSGADIHSVTASTITEAGQPTDRQGAKEHTFKPLINGGVTRQLVMETT